MSDAHMSNAVPETSTEIDPDQHVDAVDDELIRFETAISKVAGMSVILLFVGGLLHLSPILVTGRGIALSHNLAVGGIIALVAGAYVVWVAETRRPYAVVTAVVALLGVWAAVSPFVLGFEDALLAGMTILLGGLIALFGVASTYYTVRSRSTGSASPSLSSG